MQIVDKEFCMSSYLSFRYVVKENFGFSNIGIPKYPKVSQDNLHSVKTSFDIDRFLEQYFNELKNETLGLLLSGGMDSAILASYLLPDTKAYTIRFVAPGAIDESLRAEKYANKFYLKHKIVDVFWGDYLQHVPVLMKNKKAPLHAIEAALYKAALTAKDDGVTTIIIGNGADSNFGGLDKLLSKDWYFNEFVKRYTFIEPSSTLVKPIDMIPIYETYRNGELINYLDFLRNIHGVGIIQAFKNAIELSGLRTIEPYENLKLDDQLDLSRIRNGESKYLIRELFSKKYPNFQQPNKVPFSRPMDSWLNNWDGPKRKEFIHECTRGFIGDQKWLVYCLEWFLNSFDL